MIPQICRLEAQYKDCPLIVKEDAAAIVAFALRGEVQVADRTIVGSSDLDQSP